ncbi:MAG: DUF4143 domain-containing protein [Mariniblastus sp.]|nr:DUF4143 domain-containing protein [Mariniblastus sp.]
MDWLEDLIRTYLERDVPQMGFRVPATRLRRLWTMLSHLQGEPINYSKIAANLEMDAKSVSHYIDILTELLLVRRLEPWHANVKKRLVKSPRFYVRDSGIQHRLLAIGSYEALLSNPVLGKSWEGFVVENIHSVLPRRAETFLPDRSWSGDRPCDPNALVRSLGSRGEARFSTQAWKALQLDL